MMKENNLKKIAQRFRDVHQCHTAILYGSMARGDHGHSSDYDVIGFIHNGEAFRDTNFDGSDFILDGFIYPDKDVIGKENEFIRIVDGVVLFEEDGFGSKLLNKTGEICKKGPLPETSNELKAISDWTLKVLERMKRGDAEADYRRHWLLFSLLEDYFKFRTLWFEGPKKALQYLEKNDLEVFELFSNALKPNASDEDIKKLALRVIS